MRFFPKAAMLRELRRDADAANEFAAMLARQAMTLRTRLERRNIHSARNRIRHFLTVSADADRRTGALPGTLKELAVDLGLTHEALYRTLARMEADGEITRTRGVIKIERTA